jgi:hypothetical protein
MKKRIVCIGILLCAVLAWGEFTFSPLPFTIPQSDSITVISWGIGDSFSENMAKTKAKSNAMMLLAQQANGQRFTYTKTSGAVNFNATSGGKFADVTELNFTPLGGREHLMVLSARTAAPHIDAEKAVSYRVQTNTTELSKTLIELSKAAVEKLIAEHYPKAIQLTGTLYYLDMQITHDETTNSIALTMDVVIVAD